jgi:hypothetical protein
VTPLLAFSGLYELLTISLFFLIVTAKRARNIKTRKCDRQEGAIIPGTRVDAVPLDGNALQLAPVAAAHLL